MLGQSQGSGRDDDGTQFYLMLLRDSDGHRVCQDAMFPGWPQWTPTNDLRSGALDIVVPVFESLFIVLVRF